MLHTWGIAPVLFQIETMYLMNFQASLQIVLYVWIHLERNCINWLRCSCPTDLTTLEIDSNGVSSNSLRWRLISSVIPNFLFFVVVRLCRAVAVSKGFCFRWIRRGSWYVGCWRRGWYVAWDGGLERTLLRYYLSRWIRTDISSSLLGAAANSRVAANPYSMDWLLGKSGGMLDGRALL